MDPQTENLSSDLNKNDQLKSIIENCISVFDNYILEYIKICNTEVHRALNSSPNYLKSNSIAKLIELKRANLLKELLEKKNVLKESINENIQLADEIDTFYFSDLLEKRIKSLEQNYMSLIKTNKQIDSNLNSLISEDEENDDKDNHENYDYNTSSLDKFTDFLSDTEIYTTLKYFKLQKNALVKKFTKTKKQKNKKKFIDFIQTNIETPTIGIKKMKKHSSDSKLEQMLFFTNMNINLNELFINTNNKKLNESDSSSNNWVSSDEQSEACFIIEDSDSNETLDTESNTKAVEKYTRLKIKCGMGVLALKNPVKHIWQTARLVKIKPLDNSFNYDTNKLKSNTYCKYLIEFDEFTEPASLNILKEYENHASNNEDDSNSLDELNDYSSNYEYNSSLEDENSSDLDEGDIEIIVTQKGKEPIKKRKPIEYKRTTKKKTIKPSQNELVELDASSVAFLETTNSSKLPDLPYIDYDPGTKTYILPIRSRVVTLYKVFLYDSNDRKLIDSEHLCSGTIAELPNQRNSDRYLVIFDNGFVSYAKPTDVFPIFDLFKTPFNRLDLDHACFIQNYFQHYPNRLMVHLDINDIVGLYVNKKWHQLKVIESDASLVRLDLDSSMFDIESTKIDDHSVWYYRGSFNFLPLYETIINKINESDRLDDYEKHIKDKKQINDFKLTSIFSSTSFPRNPPAKSKLKIRDELRVLQGQSKLLELSNIIRNELANFTPHGCSNTCVVKWETSLEQVKFVNPLLMPALHGWQRHIGQQTQTLNAASKKWVKYMAPCGRMLRSTGEVDHYLLLTNSKLTIDMFSFDCFILTDREFEANAKFLKIADITEGKETIPISCVNCVDSSRPENYEYSIERIALEGVPLDTNIQQMEGCKCEDNCRDRSKCSCWHKTFEATTFDIKNEMNTNVGYRGRRLQEFVSTGIFECNPLCKCDHRCSNRVVQNGISLRLQLFKTPNKGWAIRCLDDIPKGQFICTYTGHLMTEEQSDIRALETGDVYFAELDFVECLSRLKAGYVFKSDNEIEDNDLDSSSSTKNELNITLNSNKRNRALRKKTNSNLNKTYDDDVICLDSDEDEQDRTERIASLNLEKSQQARELESKMAQMREEKKRNVKSSIITNGFFTNENNRFFYQDYLNDPRIFIMDAKLCGNIGRFFNHSCSPNVFVQNVFVDTYDLRFPWLAFFALNSIRAGTELSWDYQYTVGSVPGKEIYCRCGSTNCRKRLI